MQENERFFYKLSRSISMKTVNYSEKARNSAGLRNSWVIHVQIQPIVTDGVALSVCRSVCHDREPCKNRWTDSDAAWDVDSGGSKAACACYVGMHIDATWQIRL